MKKIGWALVSTFVICIMLSAFAIAQESVELKGMITGRAADNMIVRAADGTNHVVVLTDETKVRMPKGLGLRHQEMAWTSLIPGLAVKVKGSANPQGQMVASVVEFTKDSLRMASMIQAGLQPTQRDVEMAQKDIAANREDISKNRESIAETRDDVTANTKQIAKNAQETNDRFASLADYDVKDQLVVYFKTGSSAMSEKDKAALTQLASTAKNLPGFLIEVKGFADSTGGAAMNQTLSKNRAEAVINHLLQNCNIPPRHVLAPGAMGISNPVASNETGTGRANNRRVEVRVMVNKGVASSAGK